MMDKLMVTETPPLFVSSNGTGGYTFTTPSVSDYRNLTGVTNPTLSFVHEQSIDLTGYVLQDMTTYFRQSFEQSAGLRSVTWSASTSKPLVSFSGSYLELTLVSTVPLEDSDLAAAILIPPGFTSVPITNLTFGNFNRDHIIHGRYCIYGIDTTLGADPLDGDGAGYNRLVQEYDFSSLQPVAVDRLYCYRLFSFSPSFQLGGAGALTSISIPPKRILLDATMDKEEDIPYLMRLKRGYELANQV